MEKAAFLKSAGVPFSITENRTAGSEVTFTKSPSDTFEIKIPAEHQENVIRLFNEKYNIFPSKENNILYEFRYLLRFSNDELIEVIARKDEWSEEAIESAILILGSRGISISQEEKFRLWKERNELLRKGEKVSTGWLTIGFILCLTGGIIGILFGLGLYKMKRKDLFGKEYFAYDQSSRKAGFTMILAGSIVWLCIVLYQLL